MRRISRPLATVATLALLAVGLLAEPAAALSVDKAELRGNELRLEGGEAAPNADIVADGIVVGSADGGGTFDVRFAPFSSATCVATVSDGVDTQQVSLDRCTPSAPTNQPPTAVAGADQTVIDTDGDGAETVLLDGSASSDPEGPVASHSWESGGTVLGTGATLQASFGLGAHVVTLTVTDADGVTATDALTVTVDAAPPGNLSPVANAGPDQTVDDLAGDGVETITLDGSASTDPDGTIVSWEWSENGVVLGGSSNSGGGAGPAPSAVSGGTFDHLFESNQPDPPGVIPNAFGGYLGSAGDVNGDGFDDVIIGSEVWNANDFTEGAAFVFLGGPNGPVGTNPSDAHAVIEMNQAAATVQGVSTAGDVNGDGFADIIVGSHFYDSVLPGTQLGVDGAAFVFHGGPTGITATGPADADASIFANQLTSGMGDYVDSAGDVNGDGFDDILVSVTRQGTLFPPEIPPNDRSGNYGAVLLFHGGPTGVTGTGFDDADTVILPYVDTGQPLPPVDAQVGQAAGAGDINGDGFDDVVVGGTEVTVYLGGPSGITAQNVFEADDRIFGSPALGISQGIGGAGTGFLVDGAGDINGDGFADVVAANPGRTLDPLTVPVQEGAVYVFLGGPTGLGVTSVDQAHTAIFGTIGVETVGFSVAGPGDVDGDGFDDLLVGALHYAGSLDSEGVAYLYRGGPAGIAATTVAEADSRLEAIQSGAARLGNRYAFDAQGAGDIDNDGFADVLVGKGYYDNGELNEGAAFLHRGEPFPANPNQPPVAVAGPDQTIVDEDADGTITVTLSDGGSFDADGSIVSHQWYLATGNAATGETLVATGPAATIELPLISPIPAWGHILTLVVTDDQGVRRGDTVNVFPQLAPDSFEFAEWLDLSAWSTTGDVTLGDTGAPTPATPHIRMRGASTLERTFTPTPGTTGLDIQFWAQGDLFGPGDTAIVQASFDGGPFVDHFTLTPADVNGGFVFYGGSAVPISMSWWPATASTVTLRFVSNLSPGADFWLSTLTVRSIQAPTGGATNQAPTAAAGPDQIVIDADGSGAETVTLDGSASFDLDGTVVGHEWRNGATTIGNSAVITPSLTVGTHVLSLIVTDDLGIADIDTVIVTVQDAPAGGGPTLDVDLAVGTHTITLTVTDDQGATASDQVQVTVNAVGVNQPPVANAGPDQTVGDTDNTGGELVTLDGTGSSDAEGAIASYVWRRNGIQIAAGPGPDVPLDVGIHTIELTVIDGDGASATDVVVITVDPFDPATNQSPVADAGPDQTIVDLDGNTLEVVTFDGTGSFDPDGSIVAWSWTLNGNPFGNAPTFSVTRPVGTDVVTLTVTDNLGATASDTVVVTVEAPPDPTNTPPTAVAGPDVTLDDPDGDGLASAAVDGTGSFDAEGPIASYEWRLNGTLVATSAIAGIPFPVGVNTLELTVRDGDNATGVDTAIVTVVGNQAPIAVAGADQAVVDGDGDGTASVTVSAAGSSDPDGAVAFWAWRTGGNVVGTTETATFTLPVGVHNVELTVTDDGGATAVDTLVITVDAAPPGGDPESASVSIDGPTSINRGDQATWMVVVTNTGTSDLTGATVRIVLPGGRLLRRLSPAAVQPVPVLAAGASTTVTWTAEGDKEGSGSITAEVSTSVGALLATAAHGVTVIK